jgi:hypothetical protein
MPSASELDLKAQREERLRERSVAERQPLRARIESIDAAGRSVINAVPAIALAVASIIADPRSPLAWLAAAAFFFHRWTLYKAIAWVAKKAYGAAKEQHAKRQETKHKAARAAEAETAAAARKAEEDIDSIDGVPMHTIASALAAGADVPLMHTLQGTLNFSNKKANAIRSTLMAARFLVWPFEITDRQYALGDEAVAENDKQRDRATMLHPTLRTVTAAERAHVIEDALRRAKGITPLPELKIRGELTERGRKMYGRTLHAAA